mgnify:CR=1 FL=1
MLWMTSLASLIQTRKGSWWGRVHRVYQTRSSSAVGSTMVSDLAQLMALLEAGEPWHMGTTRYCITRKRYPGIGKLIPSR